MESGKCNISGFQNFRIRALQNLYALDQKTYLLEVLVYSFCYFRTLSFPACMACYGIPRAGRNAWMYSCLEKELGPSLLVERLLEHSCADKNKPH